MFYTNEKKKQSDNQRNRSKLLKNPTEAELIMKSKLDKIKIKNMFQKGFWKGDFSCIVDFYLPKPYKIVIEVDGGYHTTDKQKYRDSFKDRYLIEERGFKVLRFTNEEAKEISLTKLKDMIRTL